MLAEMIYVFTQDPLALSPFSRSQKSDQGILPDETRGPRDFAVGSETIRSPAFLRERSLGLAVYPNC